MQTVNVDTRSYNRNQFVQSLLSDVCGSHYDECTPDEAIEYIDEQVSIVDFDGTVHGARRWKDDIRRELGK
jgi:hypothetical protein